MWAQSPKVAEATRPALFFREDFRDTPAATPITQEHIGNPKVLLALYGPGKDGMKKSHHDTPADDPFYIWDGTCEGNCAATLRDKSSYADLRGQAKIQWRTKQSGFRRLHIILKLAAGDWLVSEPVEVASTDWRESEAVLQDLHWRRLDIRTLVEGAAVERPGPQPRRRDRLEHAHDRRQYTGQFTRGLDCGLRARHSAPTFRTALSEGSTRRQCPGIEDAVHGGDHILSAAEFIGHRSPRQISARVDMPERVSG